MPGHHKRAEAYSPKGVQGSGPDEEKKCLGNKDHSHLSSLDYSVLKETTGTPIPWAPILNSPSTVAQGATKSWDSEQFHLCILNFDQVQSPFTVL